MVKAPKLQKLGWTQFRSRNVMLSTRLRMCRLRGRFFSSPPGNLEGMTASSGATVCSPRRWPSEFLLMMDH